ncbi:MAG: hypothetical protein R6V85_14675 [Polyangia bacterium]
MSEQGTGSSTVVTRVTKDKKDDHPSMSYTAVTTHREMAEAFVRELLRVGQKIIPDHELDIEDLISICHAALDRREDGVQMLEGRHLRGRIGEQLSRADRYGEAFSVMVLGFDDSPDETTYEAVVDTLYERMRKTDLVFLFKARIVLILPHTNGRQIDQFNERIDGLLAAAFGMPPLISRDTLTYPSEGLPKPSAMLDWVEDKLRT